MRIAARNDYRIVGSKISRSSLARSPAPPSPPSSESNVSINIRRLFSETSAHTEQEGMLFNVCTELHVRASCERHSWERAIDRERSPAILQLILKKEIYFKIYFYFVKKNKERKERNLFKNLFLFCKKIKRGRKKKKFILKFICIL